MTLNGTLILSDYPGQRTCGGFGKLIRDNAKVFRRHFGVDLFEGSLNVAVSHPPSLQADLDAGRPAPAFIVPKTELINMPPYIGHGQAWRCELTGDKFPNVINCWIFRRKGSRVLAGVIELVACEKLRTRYKLQHGDTVVMAIV